MFVFDGSADAVVTASLIDLLPFTVYECTVSAATNGGMGSASVSSVNRTTEDGQ